MCPGYNRCQIPTPGAIEITFCGRTAYRAIAGLGGRFFFVALRTFFCAPRDPAAVLLPFSRKQEKGPGDEGLQDRGSQQEAKRWPKKSRLHRSI